MPRALDRQKEYARQLAVRSGGQNQHSPRFLSPQVQAGPYEAEAFGLPGVVDASPVLQTATGAMRFIWGVSEFDGTDVME